MEYLEKLREDVLISRKLHLEIRKRLVRCYVLSTLLYASESWTLDRQIEDKINAFEMWILDACSGYRIWTERLI